MSTKVSKMSWDDLVKRANAISRELRKMHPKHPSGTEIAKWDSHKALKLIRERLEVHVEMEAIQKNMQSFYDRIGIEY